MTAGGWGEGEERPFYFIFVLVGLKEACMSNFSFLGSFSGTSPGRAGGRVLDFSKLRLSQPSLAGSWAELGNSHYSFPLSNRGAMAKASCAEVPGKHDDKVLVQLVLTHSG